MKLEGGSADLRRGGVLLAVGAAGGLTAQGIGIPAGMVIGALLTSGLYRLAGGDPGRWRSRYGQMGRLLLGTVIGAAFGPDVLAPLKSALLPMIVLIALIVGVGLGLGWALSRFTPLDMPTSLVSSMPGGFPAMASIAEETDADATVVAVIHFSRLVTILVLMPALMPFLVTAHAGVVDAASLVEPVGFWRTALTLADGIIGGLVISRLGLPSGDLIGSILVVGGANLLWAGAGPLAGGFRQAAMLLVGTAVGAQMSRESLSLLRQVALPAGVVIAVLIGVGLLLGWGLSQVTSLDPATALLSSVPGGASTMPAVAHDLGGDMRLVAALHLMRQLVVFVLLPMMLSRSLRGRYQKHVVV